MRSISSLSIHTYHFNVPYAFGLNHHYLNYLKNKINESRFVSIKVINTPTFQPCHRARSLSISWQHKIVKWCVWKLCHINLHLTTNACHSGKKCRRSSNRKIWEDRETHERTHWQTDTRTDTLTDRQTNWPIHWLLYTSSQTLFVGV